MPQFSPNLYHQFLELPARERFAAAAEIGATAVEWHFPYVIPKRELKQLLDDNGLRFIYAVVPANWAKADYGLAAQPGRGDEFRRTADVALEYAFEANFYSLNVSSGRLPDGVERQRCIECYIENLDYISAQAKGHPVLFVIEGVCNARFPNYVIQTIGEAAEVASALNRDNVKLVFDTYHLRWEETGPLTTLMDAHLPMIGHIQVGNAPERHEPGVGEVDLHHLIEHADRNGYRGWIGLEYYPSKDTWSSLAWMNRYGFSIEGRPSRATRPAKEFEGSEIEALDTWFRQFEGA